MISAMTKNNKIIQDFILGKRNFEDTVNKLSNEIEKFTIKECKRAINMEKNKTALDLVRVIKKFVKTKKAKKN